MLQKFHQYSVTVINVLNVIDSVILKPLLTYILYFIFLAKEPNDVVAVRQGNIMITSFHPELIDDLRFHKYLVDMVIDPKRP